MKSVTCKRSGALIVELFTVWFPTNPARGNSDVALGSRDQVYLAVIFLMRWHMLPRARIVRVVRGMLSSLVNFLPNYCGSVRGWDPEPLWHILPWLPTACASGNLLKKTHMSSKQAVEPRGEVWCVAMAAPPRGHIMPVGEWASQVLGVHVSLQRGSVFWEQGSSLMGCYKYEISGHNATFNNSNRKWNWH